MVVHGCVSLLKVHTFFSGKLKVHSLKKTQNPKHFIGHLHNSGETSVFESYHLTRKLLHIWKNCFSKKKSTTAPPNVFFVPSSFLGEKQNCFGASNWGGIQSFHSPNSLSAPASGPSSRSPNIGRSWSLPSVAWGIPAMGSLGSLYKRRFLGIPPMLSHVFLDLGKWLDQILFHRRKNVETSKYISTAFDQQKL